MGTKGDNTTISGSVAGAIGGIIDIPGAFGASCDIFDDTTFDSEDGWKEKGAGLFDAGQITFTVEYDGAAGGEADKIHTALGVSQTWTVTPAGGSHGVWQCTGILSNYDTAIPLGDRMIQNVTFDWSGKPTFTPA